jgi:hypothetical protein
MKPMTLDERIFEVRNDFMRQAVKDYVKLTFEEADRRAREVVLKRYRNGK